MDLSKIFDLVKGILPKDWKGRHRVAGVWRDLGPVTETKTGLDWNDPLKPVEWVKFVFSDQGAPHKLKGFMRLAEAGQQGGGDTIKEDDRDVLHDDVVYGPQFRLFPPSERMVVAFKFEEDGVDHRVEFTSAWQSPVSGVFG